MERCEGFKTMLEAHSSPGGPLMSMIQNRIAQFADGGAERQVSRSSRSGVRVWKTVSVAQQDRAQVS